MPGKPIGRCVATAVLLGATLGGAVKTGPEVNATIPAFSLPDQNGTIQSLKTITGPKGAVLVFYRSADWCVYCKGQLAELQTKLVEFRNRGLNVAAISYDSPAILKNFATRRAITFPLLSDEGSNTIRAFGILNEEAPAGTPFAGIPHPGTYIVDPSGRVTAKYFEEDYTQRFTASEILVRQFGAAAGSAHTTTETRHLKLSSSASAAGVRSGQRIALTLDIELKPEMHVYAPGVTGYIPIEWTMKPNDGVVAHPMVAPPSKRLHLPAIDETVSVYGDRFRLVRDITIGKDAKLKPLLDAKGNLAIEGTFRYQACDNRMCYLPQRVPMKWSVHVEAPDRERVPASLQRK